MNDAPSRSWNPCVTANVLWIVSLVLLLGYIVYSNMSLRHTAHDRLYLPPPPPLPQKHRHHRESRQKKYTPEKLTE